MDAVDQDQAFSDHPERMHHPASIEQVAGTSSQPDDFLWINVGDDDEATKRQARAHVMKVFRRGERRAKGGDDDMTQPNARRSLSVIAGEASLKSNADRLLDESVIDVENESLELYSDPGPHGVDPFVSYPVKLDSTTSSLIHYWCYQLNPDSFRLANSSFQTSTALVFRVCLADSASFHTLLGLSATHLDFARGRSNSDLGTKFITAALAITNKNMSQLVGPPSDEMIAEVATYVGHEILFGTPQGINSHMKGMELMLSLRGGLETLRYSNPDLWGMIHWLDYSASCQYVSKTRFAPATDVTKSNPLHVPPAIYRYFPAGYDQLKFIGELFLNLRTYVLVARSSFSTLEEHPQSIAFVKSVEAGLSKSITINTKPRSKLGRRLSIEVSHQIIALIVIAFMSQGIVDGYKTANFVNRLYTTLSVKSEEWATVTVKLLVQIMSAQDTTSTAYYSKMVDLGMLLDGATWRYIKLDLMTFFEYDYGCEGPLKTRWKLRMAAAQRQARKQLERGPVDIITDRLRLEVQLPLR